jgi:hypothetical protein
MGYGMLICGRKLGGERDGLDEIFGMRDLVIGGFLEFWVSGLFVSHGSVVILTDMGCTALPGLRYEMVSDPGLGLDGHILVLLGV